MRKFDLSNMFNLKSLLRNIFNFFKIKGYEIQAFSIMIIFTFFSFCIVLWYSSEFGTTLQNSILFLGKSIEQTFKLISEYDSKSPGVLSLTGTILGALIGFLGVIMVFFLQGNYQYKQDKKRLMILLLCTYECLVEFYQWLDQYQIDILKEYQTNPGKFEYKYKEKAGEFKYKDKTKACDRFLKIYSEMIYDKEWRKLIITIKNMDDLNFLMELFLNIELVAILDKDIAEEKIEKLKEILIFHGYRKKVKFIENKLEKEAEKRKSKLVD